MYVGVVKSGKGNNVNAHNEDNEIEPEGSQETAEQREARLAQQRQRDRARREQGRNQKRAEFVFTQRYVHVIIFSNFSVQITHCL